MNILLTLNVCHNIMTFIGVFIIIINYSVMFFLVTNAIKMLLKNFTLQFDIAKFRDFSWKYMTYSQNLDLSIS